MLNPMAHSLNKLRINYDFKKEDVIETKKEYKKGDIIITKSVSFNGFLGHVGIFVSPTHILHTSRWIGYPFPKLITVDSFKKRYKKNIVIRPNSPLIGEEAADIALERFYNKNIGYKISRNPKLTKNNTYCSELVWHAYYKAGLEFKIFNSNYFKDGSWVSPGSKDFIYPYDFANPIYVKYNGFSFIHIT